MPKPKLERTTSPPTIAKETAALLGRLGAEIASSQPSLTARTPISGETMAQIPATPVAAVSDVVARSAAAFEQWRKVPAPRRGELVRLLGETLRQHKADLGRLVTLETGKILSEGLGEVQEMIDICDFAVGLSRQLYGRTITTERPDHRMMETWHPLGPTGIITAFNFPVAVWAWNAAIALVCGNPVIWKPSEKTPLTAVATHALFKDAAKRFGGAPDGLAALLIGGRDVGEALVDDPRVPLVSATGSTAMGRAVGQRLAKRFGRALLELGGNNAAIVAPSANLDLAVRAIAFSAIGTAGQRCTSLRRLIVHADVAGPLVARLHRVYASAPVGDPRDDTVLVGPLIDGDAYQHMQTALAAARAAGARVTGGHRMHADRWPDAFYVTPALADLDFVERSGPPPIVRTETFAPILYVMRYRDMAEAIALHNDVPQGLASSIFTRALGEAERFMSAAGSDCGIVNVNIGPSGAEIGGAFAGEKETGGRRESGSDAWKAYMRRATNTINYGTTLPLAQGVRFDIES